MELSHWLDIVQSVSERQSTATHHFRLATNSGVTVRQNLLGNLRHGREKHGTYPVTVASYDTICTNKKSCCKQNYYT